MTPGSSDEGRAVPLLLGIGIAVTLVVLLAAVVTMVILGADEATDDGSPEMEFSFEYNPDAEPSQEDSFGNTGRSFDGLLTITYESGDVARADQLLVAGAAAGFGRAPFGPDGGYPLDEEIDAGDTITVWVNSDDAVTVVWHHLEEDQTTIVDSWTGPDR